MSLHIEQFGSGAPLVLIHGWGMHSGIWDNVIPLLSQVFCVQCVDLPGHGYSSMDETFTLDNMVDEIAAQFDKPLNICGWALRPKHYASLLPNWNGIMSLLCADSWLYKCAAAQTNANC